MKHTTRFRALAVAVSLLLVGQVCSDDKASPKKKSADPGKGAMLEAMAKAAAPGPEHKRLEDLAGNWTFTIKMWMDPAQPPTESKGTSSSKWILGGRFLAEDVIGNFMGMPFHGYSLTGYDNVQKKYVGVWMDSFGTGISHSEGTADASGKVLQFTREECEPTTGQKMKSRDVVRIVSKDKHEMDSYRILPDGKEFKMMEIRYTRTGAK